MKKIISIIILIYILSSFNPLYCEITSKIDNDIKEISTLLTDTKTLKKANLKLNNDKISKFSNELNKLNGELQGKKDSKEIELLKVKIDLVENQKRYYESLNLLYDNKINVFSNLVDTFTNLKKDIKIDEKYLKIIPSPSEIVDFVKYKEKLKKRLSIEDGKLKIKKSELEMRKKELSSFMDKVEILKKEYDEENDRILKIEKEKRDKYEVKKLDVKSGLIQIYDRVVAYLKERIEFITSEIKYRKHYIEYLKKREVSLEKVSDKIGKLAIDKAILNLKKERLNAEKNNRKIDKKKLRIKYNNKRIERLIYRLEDKLDEVKKNSKSVKNEILSNLMVEAVSLELEVAKLKKELLNMRSKNLDIVTSTKASIIDWENNKFNLIKGRLSEEKLSYLTESGKNKIAKYSEESKILYEKNKILDSELENFSDEVSDYIAKIESINSNDKIRNKKKIISLLEKCEKYLNEKIDIYEEKIFLIKQRRKLFKDRIDAINSFLVQVKKSGKIIIFGNSIRQYLLFFLSLCGVIIIAFLFNSIIFRWILKFTANTNIEMDYVVVKAVSTPFILAIVLVGFYLSLNILFLPLKLLNILLHLIKALVILDIAFFIMRGVDILVYFINPIVKKTESKLDDQLLPIISKITKIMIMSIGVIMFTESMGYPATSLLTGLGIGGLAFALAAKDTLSNIFGSMMIFSDKIFHVGDWIKFSGNEGIVEEIGIRSTKIRKFDNTLIVIPNSTVANANITNISRFQKRRIYYVLGLTYDSGYKGIENAVNIIRKILDDHPGVANDHYIFFTDFGASSLNIMCYFFANTTVWREYLEIRQEVNIKIMKELEKAGLSIAFPTTTINLDDDALSTFKKMGEFPSPVPGSN